MKPRRVAGVGGLHHPARRAWAAAPVDRAVNHLERPDGSCGIVPMNPVPFHAAPIAAWVADIDLEARTWAVAPCGVR